MQEGALCAFVRAQHGLLLTLDPDLSRFLTTPELYLFTDPLYVTLVALGTPLALLLLTTALFSRSPNTTSRRTSSR